MLPFVVTLGVLNVVTAGKKFNEYVVPDGLPFSGKETTGKGSLVHPAKAVNNTPTTRWTMLRLLTISQSDSGGDSGRYVLNS